MLDKLKEAESLLDDIQEGLEWLSGEEKTILSKVFFSRCSNDLLGILFETKDPLHIQPNLRKCFEGIDKLTFNHKREITHMESAENEKVELVLRIISASAKGLVEKWLHEVNIFSSYLGFSYCMIIFSFRSDEYYKCILNSSLNIFQDVDRFQPCCYVLQLI